MSTEQKTKICYKLATKSRFWRCKDAVDSIRKHRSPHVESIIILTLDEDDPDIELFAPLATHTASAADGREVLVYISQSLKDYRYEQGQEQHTEIYAIVGNSKGKIDAINRDLDIITHNWFDRGFLVNMSDDMLITSDQFEDSLHNIENNRRGYDRSESEVTDVFIHLPDGFANEKLCTLSIMGHTYFHRFGYIYHPAYLSLWCDNEATDVAKALGKYIYIDEHCFTHMHPANSSEIEKDEQYQAQDNPSVYLRDERIYELRKALGFPQDRDVLDILICSIPERAEMLADLTKEINRQVEICGYQGVVNVIVDNRPRGEVTIGTKRNDLLWKARSKYVAFIDDDDDIDLDYVGLVVRACLQDPDVVNIRGVYYKDGAFDRVFVHCVGVDEWHQSERAYYRGANHLNPVLRNIATAVGFPSLNNGEDRDYSDRLHIHFEQLNQVKSVTIMKEIYFYRYNSNK